MKGSYVKRDAPGGLYAHKRSLYHANVQEFVTNIDEVNYKLCKERIAIIQYMISDFRRLGTSTRVDESINLLLLKRRREEEELSRLTLALKMRKHKVGHGERGPVPSKTNAEKEFSKRPRLDFTIKETIADPHVGGVVARVSSSSDDDSFGEDNERKDIHPEETEVVHILASFRQ
jgi:hypothetical protein